MFLAISNALCCRPFWKAQLLWESLLEDQASKIYIRDRWSERLSANLSLVLYCWATRFSSWREIPSQICSVDSILSSVIMSWEQSRETIFEASRAFEKVGSSGSFASSAPKVRSLPLSSIASRRNSYLRAWRKEQSSGLSRKSKPRMSWISIDFNIRTVEVRLTLFISGNVLAGIWSLWNSAVYKRRHFPSRVRPALPDLWMA